MCDPELIFANLKGAASTVVSRCKGCDAEMNREPVLSWSCSGLFGVGKTATTSVNVPLTFHKHSRPTPDTEWVVFTDMCAKCAAQPRVCFHTRCQRCEVQCNDTFCKECGVERDVPVVAMTANANCDVCKVPWRRCTCFPYLYDPVQVYF